MLDLTNLGVLHTAIAIVAVAFGAFSLARDKSISWRTRVGQIYVVTTVITCITGFGIFQHGGFGKPHVLGVMTLVAFAIAFVAARKGTFGRASRAVETVAYTTSFFFHFIPGLVETTTRFPIGDPLIADREGPELQAAAGVVLLLCAIVCTLQVRRLRARAVAPGPATGLARS